MRGLVAITALAACAHAPVSETRFHNQPPVWRVNDGVPLTKIPEERKYYRALYHTDGFVVRRATRAMDLQIAGRAEDVNALDEVPDSTWFTNRIGARELPLDELRRGPNVDPSPLDNLPLTITGAKVGGTAVGFQIKDARGGKFLLKFDPMSGPEMETGAHIIGHRIVWACGYHVPQDYLGYVRRSDIQIAPDATQRDAFGKKQPLTLADVERGLARVSRSPDGRFRVMASRFLPGKPIGPYAREGRRHDDPNDRIPHERRRSLRGQYAIFSWLNHSDIQEDQSLDVFVDDEGGKGRGHVVHYVLDFGKALGVMGHVNDWQTVGYTYRIDARFAIQTLVSLGLWKRPWEDTREPGLRGIGLYEAAHFDPARWRTNAPYWPFEDRDRFDGFWGAKLLIRFTREQLTAIVGEAQYSDPRAAEYMVNTLVERQRKTARHWFGQVSPLDQFRVESGDRPDGAGARLCFEDLALLHGLESAPTRYRAELFDRDGRATGFHQDLAAAPDGRGCVVGFMPSASKDRYTIVKLAVQRGSRWLPPVLVHLAQRAGALHVIGLRRE